MRAILLAAGRGMRLRQEAPRPKCLLAFGGETLLARHLRLLDAAGIDEVVVATGFEATQVEDALATWRGRARVETLFNAGFERGSMLTAHVAAPALVRGGDVLLMDADVLYDARIVDALVAGPSRDRVLVDRGFEPGDEPVKVCVKDGRVVEFRKRVADGLAYDLIGESVGFFRLCAASARSFAARVAAHVAADGADLPHEEAIRGWLLDPATAVDVADVTGAPWIEIDFPDDVRRAAHDVLPLLDGRTRQAA